MAKTRVFISSTYYDMRNIRAELERFIREQGYEPVLFERGHVPYGTKEKLEDDCYREISACDILVNIIGGRFGTESRDFQHSISQNELSKAIELGKQIYVFVERAVLGEYEIYQANKELKGFHPISVNDIRVFAFLEEVFALSGRNPVQPFDVSSEIVSFLKEQWSGLFKVMLEQRSRQKEIDLIEKLDSIASTLSQLVTFLSEQNKTGDQAIRHILRKNHPLFAKIKTFLGIPYRVYFESRKEMEALLNARRTNLIGDSPWTYTANGDLNLTYNCEWIQDQPKTLVIRASLFDENGKLKAISHDEWNDEFALLKEPSSVEEEEIPF